MFGLNTLVLLICIASILHLDAISIDGQLTVIKNDCYERLAIGEKLSPKQTYKSFEHNTVSKCEKECTREQETCRAYSFGIGAKGNASCLLSRNPIKETVDLKPIGTTKDTDFDLYIKKIDCQIVLEAPDRPTENQHAEHTQNQADYLVEEEHHGSGQQSISSPHEGYQYQRPTVHNKPNPPKEDNLQHVHTLVSIASGPNNVLHPVHDILISGGAENAYGVNPQMPPFRPSDQHPYENQKPANHGDFGHSNAHLGWDDYAYGFGGSDYSPPPANHAPKPPNGYESGTSQLEIDRRKYHSYTHYDSLESETHKFGPDPHYNFYDHYDRPDPSYPNRYGSVIPHPDDYSHPQSNYEYLFVSPNSAGSGYERPNPHPQSGYGVERPEGVSYGHRPEIDDRRPGFNKGDLGYEGRPSRPNYDSLRPIGYKPQGNDGFINNHKPNKAPGYDYNSPSRYPTKSPTSTNSRPASTELTNHYEGNYNNKQYGKPDAYNEKGSIKVVAQNVGYNGEKFTSIITELENACFHRTMAGKRAVRGLVRKLSICETVEQCQQECGDERRFTCEGFNYRLDPSGRGKGECELLDLPLSRIDLIREIVPDHQYDLYTRDRNSVQVNCRLPPDAFSTGSYGNGQQYANDGNRGNMLRPYDRRPPGIARPLKRPAGGWEDDYGGPPRPIPIDPLPLPPGNSRPEYDNRRGDYSYHHSHQSHSSHSHSYHYNEHNVDRFDFHHQHEGRRPLKGIHYLPGSPKGQNPYETHGLDGPPKLQPVIVPLDEYPKAPLPPSYPVGRYPEPRPEGGLYGGRFDYRNRYENNQKNYYVPSRPHRPRIPADWGRYGGRYGIGNGDSLEYQGYGNGQVYDYWGFNKLQGGSAQAGYESHPQRPSGTYLPSPAPTSGGYLPTIGGYEIENSILPAEPRRPPTFDFIRDASSVPDIHDCELLCVKEKAFPCSSYAFRYISFADNCQLSNRNYKELDYYTDVQPDKDFDIYTMNNRHRCPAPNEIPPRDESDCFWRVRSGQRLHESVVRDSLTVRSIVDCQLECLNSRRFTCRAYSFRYNPPIIGGPIDNCQLSDCPFFELNPRADFLPEPGFEVYERGSFGHGCEPNHFSIREKHPTKQPGLKVDQLCYVGFGSAAKLLPQATVKSVYVPTELDCKQECSQAREKADFRCMTFSFVTEGTHIAHNCFLSDIIQRDLLPNVDYINDPSSWIFTWDNYNPECTDLAHKSLDASHSPTQLRPYGNDGLDSINPLDVWKVYSVSGWPCKRGTLCKENRAAGFWYCELESGENNAWDYCCSPDHQCGLSNGYPYSWCYVGPSKTQWRKCSDQYYPYTDRFDNGKKPWQTSRPYPPSSQNAGFRPDRPNAPVKLSPPRPSLNEYEEEFDNEFLGPPKPGGFGQPRRWPVAYLHKEMPPNTTISSDTRSTRREKAETTKLSAIKSLIDVIQNTEIKNVQYHISNDSKKSDDILTVKIPLPNLEEEPQSNSTEAAKRSNELSSKTNVQFQVVDNVHEQASRLQKSLSSERDFPISKRSQTVDSPFKYPVFRRGFVTRTNLTMSRAP